MKIIEGLKKIKDLQRKFADITEKIKSHAADMDFETPAYENQKGQVSEWIQACRDIALEIAKLRVSIQKTNLETKVSIELGGKQVTKSIAEWIHWRKDLAKGMEAVYRSLHDRGLKEGTIQQSNGTTKEIKIRRYYDPKERDQNIELYRGQPMLIDSTLEVVNATTDLIE